MGNNRVANHITQLCITLCKPFSKFTFDSNLCVTEIQNCIGSVTEVVLFFMCVVRHVKFNGLSIEIHCFCLINSETTTKLLNHHYSLHQKVQPLILRMQCVMKLPPNLTLYFAAIKWAQDNFEITISGKSGKQVHRSNYTTNMITSFGFIRMYCAPFNFILPRKCIDLAEMIYKFYWSNIPKTKLHL
ncbi:hypothetical protein PR048_006325 [Dryococelus australis]|uniref:Uncharacterized protein n=1 Tax=Dryococelus australis TaxID=614101 RepID=A0ABQ9IC02_9NEOP|nr:hypothetical protein PR048_006325 [Dryococelus australis]